MLFNNQVPNGFKILSSSPVLIIKYNHRLSLYPIKLFLIIIVLFLTLSLFIIICLLSIKPLSTLPSRIWQPDFWNFPSAGYLYFDEKRFSLPGFLAIIISLFMPLSIIYELIWNLFGISEFKAFPEKLTVKHKLLGMTRTHSILKDSLLYFKRYQIIVNNRGNKHTRGWTLKAIKNQKKFFFWHSKISLIHTKPFIYSHWLGTVLANFYQVDLQ